MLTSQQKNLLKTSKKILRYLRIIIYLQPELRETFFAVFDDINTYKKSDR